MNQYILGLCQKKYIYWAIGHVTYSPDALFAILTTLRLAYIGHVSSN